MGTEAIWLSAASLALGAAGMVMQPEAPKNNMDERRREEALANKRKMQRERDSEREAAQLEDARKKRALGSETLGGAGGGVGGEASVQKKTLKSKLGQ